MPARFSRHVVLLVACLFYVFPAFVVILNSLKTTSQYLQGPLEIPVDKLTLDNYLGALNNPSLNFPSAVVFSVLIGLSTVLITIALGGGMSYILARLRRRRLANLLYIIVVAGLTIPPEVLIIPIVKVLAFLGLLFNPIGLVLVQASINLSFVVFILVPFIRSVPIELDEAALIDGAGRFTTFWAIFPTITPAVVSVAILVFAAAWNDFLNPQILLRPGEAYTVTTGIYRGLGVHSTDWGSIFAYVVLAAVPVMILFFGLQRFVTDGLTQGAVKG